MNNEYDDNRLGGPEKKTALKMVVVIMGFCLVGYIVGPPLYWRVSELLTANIRSSTHRCPPCSCDCSSQQLLLLLDGLSSRSFTDCMKHDPEVSREMEQSSTNMLKDELRLSEEEAQKKQQRADLALLEAKKMTSQYQKEAEKCNFGMDSCEEAREKAEDVVEEQRKLTAIWELRARERGWREGIKRCCDQLVQLQDWIKLELIQKADSHVFRIMEMFIVQLQLRKFEIQFKDSIFSVLLYDEDEILRWFCKEEEEEGRMIISNQIMKSSHPTADHQTVKVSQPTGIAMMMMIYMEPKQE